MERDFSGVTRELGRLLDGLGAEARTLVEAGLLGVLVLGLLSLGWQLRRWFRRIVVRRRSRDARRGEASAARLLRSAGYEILGSQVAQAWIVEVDGVPRPFALRVDYLVERHGNRYVADAKTGAWASSLSNGATRRQLLEYTLAYGASGALLVDTQRRCVRTVLFPHLER